MMIILGVDPGFATLGVAVIEKDKNSFKSIYHTAIITKPKTSFETRLKILYDGMVEVIRQYQPEVMAIEKLFFNTNITTALPVAEARGVVILAAANHGIPVVEYTPLQVKQAMVGYGRATKEQMQKMVKSILKLDQTPKPDDVADALAIAICHGQSAGYGKLMSLYQK